MIRRKRYFPPKPIKPWAGPKPELRMQVTPTCRVHYQDLEAYLAKVYRMLDYSVRQATGAQADMTPEFIVTGRLPPILNQQVDNIRRGRKTHRNLGLILDVLCVDGFIRKGKYVIDMTEEDKPLDQYRTALYETQNPLDSKCLKIRNKYKGDKEFIHQATIITRKFNEIREEEIDGYPDSGRNTP